MIFWIFVKIVDFDERKKKGDNIIVICVFIRVIIVFEVMEMFFGC